MDGGGTVVVDVRATADDVRAMGRALRSLPSCRPPRPVRIGLLVSVVLWASAVGVALGEQPSGLVTVWAFVATALVVAMVLLLNTSNLRAVATSFEGRLTLSSSQLLWECPGTTTVITRRGVVDVRLTDEHFVLITGVRRGLVVPTRCMRDAVEVSRARELLLRFLHDLT